MTMSTLSLSRRRGAAQPPPRCLGSVRCLISFASLIPIFLVFVLVRTWAGSDSRTFQTLHHVPHLSPDENSKLKSTEGAHGERVKPPEREARHVARDGNVAQVNEGRDQKDVKPSLGPRRTKAHFCYSKVHGQIGTLLLRSEFGFQAVNAEKDEEWDLIFGGYPHCGKAPPHWKKYHGNRHGWDWNMEFGLNRVLNERGWNNLKPHQVYHPCMGCKNSYCNKRELCKILRGISPELCYVLPDDKSRLTDAMDGTRVWVMKEDGTDVHIHAGSGVSYLKSSTDLPSSPELSKGMHLVQPWIEPFLGDGMWRRKTEMRAYVAVTSVYPLRAYVHERLSVVVAGKEYTHAAEAMLDKCMHDTHSATEGCDMFVSPDFEKELKEIQYTKRLIWLEDYVERTGMTESQNTELVKSAHELMWKVLKAGHRPLEDHNVNEGIHSSGAMCFSHMRVDMGISADAKPYIFEISEFPGLYGNCLRAPTANSTCKGGGTVTSRDLFKMIGLDQAPVPRDMRAEFESRHQGGWRLLPTQ